MRMCGLLQELHADSPHGPWAFVLSLTDWEHRGFTGGETTIFQPHMLNFWSSFDPDKGFEFKDMVCSYTGQCRSLSAVTLDPIPVVGLYWCMSM